jgi:hypothetical protein
MKTISTFLGLLFVFSCLAQAANVKKENCSFFYDALKGVPHKTLVLSGGEHESVWDGTKYFGCEVKLVTNNALLSGYRAVPRFHATKETDMYRNGWRMNNSYIADGPGSGTFGIERGGILCIISRDQPAELDEKTREITQSETLTIIVQCRQK